MVFYHHEPQYYSSPGNNEFYPVDIGVAMPDVERIRPTGLINIQQEIGLLRCKESPQILIILVLNNALVT